jgi:hypothetical protein
MIVKGVPRATMVSTQLRVNGIVFVQVGLRPNDQAGNEFDLVVQHPRLGSFALHEEFVLEIVESREEIASWRKVSLPQLKDVFAHAMGTCEMKDVCEGKLSVRPGSAIAGDSRPQTDFDPFPRIPVEGDLSHLRRSEEAFTERGIRYRLVGGQGSGGRHWGHANYAVSDLLEAWKCVRRAGFFSAGASKDLFTDSLTGWSIRLLPMADIL